MSYIRQTPLEDHCILCLCQTEGQLPRIQPLNEVTLHSSNGWFLLDKENRQLNETLFVFANELILFVNHYRLVITNKESLNSDIRSKLNQ